MVALCLNGIRYLRARPVKAVRRSEAITPGQYTDMAKCPFNMTSGAVTRAHKDFNLTKLHSFLASTQTGKGSQN